MDNSIPITKESRKPSSKELKYKQDAEYYAGLVHKTLVEKGSNEHTMFEDWCDFVGRPSTYNGTIVMIKRNQNYAVMSTPQITEIADLYFEETMFGFEEFQKYVEEDVVNGVRKN